MGRRRSAEEIVDAFFFGVETATDLLEGLDRMLGRSPALPTTEPIGNGLFCGVCGDELETLDAVCSCNKKKRGKK